MTGPIFASHPPRLSLSKLLTRSQYCLGTLPPLVGVTVDAVVRLFVLHFELGNSRGDRNTQVYATVS
jgi:hypothetical protein